MSNLAKKSKDYIKINKNVKETLKQINLIHENDDGFISIAVKNIKTGSWNQWHYNKDELTEETLSYFIKTGEKNDIYISHNSFYIPIRKVENIRHLNSLFIDIDNHEKIINDDDIRELLDCLENDYFDIKFPRPSILYRTGRGIQFELKLEHLPKQALPLWQLVENKLIEVLKEINVGGFKVDINCCDAARVGRLVETTNTKSKTICEIIEINEITYRLDKLIEDYFQELKIVKNKSKKNKTLEEKKIVNLFNIHNLHYSRLLDIIRIRDIRNGECEGHREFMCFLYRYYSILFTKDKEKALNDTLEFNQGFKNPLSKKEVIKQTKSSEKAFDEWLKNEKNGVYPRGGYNYSNNTLIRKLNITMEEQNSLITIISAEEKNIRKKLANKKSRRNTNGLTKKQQELYELKIKVIELKKEGLNNCAIGRVLNINESKVRRLLK
ncbi:DNA-binding response regulator [Clostridium thermobutyricum]